MLVWWLTGPPIDWNRTGPLADLVSGLSTDRVWVRGSEAVTEAQNRQVGLALIWHANSHHIRLTPVDAMAGLAATEAETRGPANHVRWCTFFLVQNYKACTCSLGSSWDEGHKMEAIGMRRGVTEHETFMEEAKRSKWKSLLWAELWVPLLHKKVAAAHSTFVCMWVSRLWRISRRTLGQPVTGVLHVFCLSVLLVSRLPIWQQLL